MHRRIPLLIAAVAALCLAIAVPTASAATKTDKAQTKAIKKQAKSIKKNAKSIKKNSAGIKKGSQDVAKLNSSTTSAGNAINTLKVIADRADANAKTVLDAAPAIIKGLTDLKTGLEAAGAGLTSLQKLATSQEYGFGQVIVLEAGPTPNPQEGSFIETPDIPDTVQQAMTTQQFVAQNAGDPDRGLRRAQQRERRHRRQQSRRGLQGHGDQPDGRHRDHRPGAVLGNVRRSSSCPTKSTLTSTVAGNAGFPFGLKTVAPDADVTQNLDDGRGRGHG